MPSVSNAVSNALSKLIFCTIYMCIQTNFLYLDVPQPVSSSQVCVPATTKSRYASTDVQCATAHADITGTT